jgi:cytoskeletal protein RodZ
VSEHSLGDKLKNLREQQGLSREQLYSRTKILVNYIEALEEGRWDLLPGQAYLKPFVKNIADALGADYAELVEIIDRKEKKDVPQEIGAETKGFDYRWLVVILMAVLVALIILILKPLESNDQQPVGESPAVIEESEPNHTILERKFSSDLDINQDMFEDKQFYNVVLTATDSVWIVLTSENDTLYAGILAPGRVVRRESIQPIELFMARMNCLEVTYNGIPLGTSGVLRDQRRVNFAEVDLERLKEAGDR